MSAIRLARAFTKKKLIIKIEGCYHGHADFLLVKAGSGAMTYGIPSSKGVPKEITKLTLTIPYNNIEALDTTIQQFKQEIACIIIEPVAGNMGVVLPEPGFLQYIREETKKHEILLIFDEVITGFRLAYGGAAERYKIDPDLICLGKIIGGGLPIGAFGGRKDIMQLLAPEGPVYQAGTLSGNPLSVKAGIKTLEILKRELPYPELEQKTERLKQGLVQAAKKRGVSVHINQIASMLTLFFTSKKVFDYKTALSADTNKFSQFHKAMLNQGIYLPPSQFEAWFLSLAHTTDDIEETISCADRAFKDIL
jgi:glutamate-1-semialdehyde 2,1-aminomutase